MKINLTTFLFAFTFAAKLFSQIYNISPNTEILIQRNGVKKQTIIVDDKIVKTKEVNEVLFFDSTGACFKKVRKIPEFRSEEYWYCNYYYETWSTAPKPAPRICEFGYYDKDSIEVIKQREIYTYDKKGNVLEIKGTSQHDSGFYTHVIKYQYSQDYKYCSFFAFVLNPKIDTIKKIIHIERDSLQFTASYVAQKGLWIEEYKHVYIFDSHHFEIQKEHYEYGVLKNKETNKFAYDSLGKLVEMSSFDINNKICRKIIYDDGGKEKKIWEYNSDGKILAIETQDGINLIDSIYKDGKFCWRSNGIPDPNPRKFEYDFVKHQYYYPFQIDDMHGPCDVPDTTNFLVKRYHGSKRKPHFKPRTVIASDGSDLPPIEYYDETGLITKRETHYEGENGKSEIAQVYYWVYEFYK